MKQPPVHLPPAHTPHTPRSSPRVRTSPKHRGGRVTFDGSRRNSSPCSRSSREKDEEAFRSTVAQNLSLTTEGSPIQTQRGRSTSDLNAKVEPASQSGNQTETKRCVEKYNPQQNLKSSSSPIQKLRDKFIADNTIVTTSSPQKIFNDSVVVHSQSRKLYKGVSQSDKNKPVIHCEKVPAELSVKPSPTTTMTSRYDDGCSTPERDVVPMGPYVPSPTLDPLEPADEDDDGKPGVSSSRDGMTEYAASYSEPSVSFKDGSQVLTVGGREAQTSVPNRRELREPDGASGSSSPTALPPTPSKPNSNGKRSGSDKDQQPGTSSNKSPGGDIEVPLIPASESSRLNDTRSKENPESDAPNIPSTNIAVAFLVTLCFNFPLGVLAVYFSLMATKSYRDGDKAKGARRARISIYISLFSIVLTVLIVMSVVLYKAIEGQAKQKQHNQKSGVRL